MIYKHIYNLLRKSTPINFIFHKIFQGRFINRLPPYVWIYNRIINHRANKWMVRPPFLEFTLTDKCNAHCIMCPPEVHMGSSFISQDLFEKIVIEATDYGIKKAVFTGGEPLLDEKIFDKIKFAKSKGIEYIHMFTNGQLLDKERSEKLILSGLDSLTVSMDSVVKAEYEKIRIGLEYDTVMTNIKNFRKYRENLKSSTPLFRLNRVNIIINNNSTREYIKEFDRHADIVEMMDAHNWGTKKGKVFFKGLLYGQEARYPCNLLFQKIVISPDGSYRKCSIDYTSNTQILGDSKTTTISEILHTEYKKIKEKMLKRDFSIDGCKGCSHKQSWWIDWDLK